MSFGALARDLGDMKALDAELSRAAEAAANRIAAQTLGADRKHTGWGVPLDVQTKRLRNKDGIVLFPTRSSAGPWTEVQRGRNQGDVGVFAGPGVVRTGKNAGTTLRTKAGNVRKVRSFKARRWNGTTQGRGAADRAVAEIDKAVMPIVERSVIALTKKHLGG